MKFKNKSLQEDYEKLQRAMKRVKRTKTIEEYYYADLDGVDILLNILGYHRFRNKVFDFSVVKSRNSLNNFDDGERGKIIEKNGGYIVRIETVTIEYSA